jgi:segregation and condensation protein A
MVEKTIPWWRKALQIALGGIRSGFGLFPRTARREPVTGPNISAEFTDHPEEERALTEPSLQVVAPLMNAAEPVPAAQPAKAAGKGRVVSKREEKHPSGAKAAPLPAAGSTVEAAGPEREAEPVVEPVPAVDTEVMIEALPEPVKEPEAVFVAETEPAADTEVTEVMVEALPEPVKEQETVIAVEPEPAAEPVSDTAIEPAVAPPLEASHEPAPEPVVIPVAAVAGVPRRALKPQRSEEEKAAARLAARQKKLDEGSEESPFSVIVGQVYDGPMDLLLDLIRKQDIDIYDIPIAIITSQFLAYVNQLRASDVDVAGDFIYTASLLIHIKSKMLLPHTETGPEQAAEDPRRELVERLLEHERFKNAAQMLLEKQMLEAATWSNPGAREFKDDVSAEPEIAADTVDLVRIFREILERARNRPVIDVEEDSVTVGQMIQFLARRLTLEDKPVALRRLLSHTHSERALIAMFLALLEMVRLQAILLRQDRQFSEIFIKKHSNFETVMNDGLGAARDDWR